MKKSQELSPDRSSYDTFEEITTEAKKEQKEGLHEATKGLQHKAWEWLQHQWDYQYEDETKKLLQDLGEIEARASERLEELRSLGHEDAGRLDGRFEHLKTEVEQKAEKLFTYVKENPDKKGLHYRYLASQLGLAKEGLKQFKENELS